MKTACDNCGFILLLPSRVISSIKLLNQCKSNLSLLLWGFFTATSQNVSVIIHCSFSGPLCIRCPVYHCFLLLLGKIQYAMPLILPSNFSPICGDFLFLSDVRVDSLLLIIAVCTGKIQGQTNHSNSELFIVCLGLDCRKGASLMF